MSRSPRPITPLLMPFTPRVCQRAEQTTAGPALREHYHPTYYAAFVHDLDGNNIEVVCHGEA